MKQLYIFAAFLLCFSPFAAKANQLSDTTQVLPFAEKMPVFPGGDSAMYAFINSSLILPGSLEKDTIVGTAYASFVVNYSGKVKDVTIVKSLRPELDSAIILAIEKMPAWQPGMQNGSKVNVRCNVPVKFNLRPSAFAEFKNISLTDAFNKQETASQTKFIPSAEILEQSFKTKGLEKMPEFPGGENSLLNFLGSNVNYPRTAAVHQIQGTVLVNFRINEQGYVDSIMLLKGVRHDLDQEALRVVKKMPKWTPGEYNNKPVPVKYTVPIRFSMKNTYNRGLEYLVDLKDPSIKYFLIVNQLPSFPQGFKKLQEHIEAHTKTQEPERKLQSAKVGFLVGKDGLLSNMEILECTPPSAEPELVNAMVEMPDWKPAKGYGEDVDCFFILEYPLPKELLKLK